MGHPRPLWMLFMSEFWARSRGSAMRARAISSNAMGIAC